LLSKIGAVDDKVAVQGMKAYGRDRRRGRQQGVWGSAPERPVPATPEGVAVVVPPPPRDLAKAGLWTAVLIWPVGAVIGIMLLARDRTREGATVLAIATVVGILSFTLLAPRGSADSCLDTAQGTTVCGPDALAWCKRNAPPVALIRPATMAGTEPLAAEPPQQSEGLCGAAH
jgi:hypothetical protein